MKVQRFRRFVFGDYPDAPQWAHRFFDAVNKQFESLTNAVAGRLNMSDNIVANIRTVEMGQDELVQITVDFEEVDAKPFLVAYASSDFDEYHFLKWSIVDTKTVQVRINWLTDPDVKPLVTLLILGN